MPPPKIMKICSPMLFFFRQLGMFNEINKSSSRLVVVVLVKFSLQLGGKLLSYVIIRSPPPPPIETLVFMIFFSSRKVQHDSDSQTFQDQVFSKRPHKWLNFCDLFIQKLRERKKFKKRIHAERYEQLSRLSKSEMKVVKAMRKVVKARQNFNLLLR